MRAASPLRARKTTPPASPRPAAAPVAPPPLEDWLLDAAEPVTIFSSSLAEVLGLAASSSPVLAPVKPSATNNQKSKPAVSKLGPNKGIDYSRWGASPRSSNNSKTSSPAVSRASSPRKAGGGKPATALRVRRPSHGGASRPPVSDSPRSMMSQRGKPPAPMPAPVPKPAAAPVALVRRSTLGALERHFDLGEDDA